MPEPKIITTSKRYTINWRDLGRGAILSVISAVLTSILNSLNAGEVTINVKNVSIVAIVTLISYMLKNFFEPQKTIIQGELSDSTFIADEKTAQALGKDSVG